MCICISKYILFLSRVLVSSAQILIPPTLVISVHDCTQPDFLPGKCNRRFDYFKTFVCLHMKLWNFAIWIFLPIICPRNSDPFNIVTYYIKWGTTSWTHSTMNTHAFTVHVLIWSCFLQRTLINIRLSHVFLFAENSISWLIPMLSKLGIRNKSNCTAGTEEYVFKTRKS